MPAALSLSRVEGVKGAPIWEVVAEYLRDVKVVNAGVGGWGITQGYLAIDDLLAARPLPTASARMRRRSGWRPSCP